MASSTSQPTLIYSMIARDQTILVQHADATGNMEPVARRILEKLPKTKEYKMSYSYETYLFNILIRDGITYIVLSPEPFGRRRAYAFLEDIVTRFQSAHGSTSHSALAFAYQDSFSKTLKVRMQHHSQPSSDNITKVKSDIDDVKNVLMENLDKVLERGEKLDVLENKTQNLTMQAGMFKKNATSLKRAMWWKNMKLNLMIAIIVIVLIAVLIGVICGTINCSKYSKKK